MPAPPPDATPADVAPVYQPPAYRVIRNPDEAFLESPRLIHLGYDNFREHHRRAEQLLNESRVQHIYQDGPQRRHHWNSGWLADAVELLARRPDESADARR